MLLPAVNDIRDDAPANSGILPVSWLPSCTITHSRNETLQQDRSEQHIKGPLPRAHQIDLLNDVGLKKHLWKRPSQQIVAHAQHPEILQNSLGKCIRSEVPKKIALKPVACARYFPHSAGLRSNGQQRHEKLAVLMPAALKCSRVLKRLSLAAAGNDPSRPLKGRNRATTASDVWQDAENPRSLYSKSLGQHTTPYQEQ